MPPKKKPKPTFISNDRARIYFGPQNIPLEAGECAIVIRDWDAADREMSGLKKRFVKESSE